MLNVSLNLVPAIAMRCRTLLSGNLIKVDSLNGPTPRPIPQGNGYMVIGDSFFNEFFVVHSIAACAAGLHLTQIAGARIAESALRPPRGSGGATETKDDRGGRQFDASP